VHLNLTLAFIASRVKVENIRRKQRIKKKQWLESQRANIKAALEKSGGKIYGKGGAAELLGLRPTTLSS